MATWAEVPAALLCAVAGLLDVGSLQQTRVVCKAWQQSASLAIHTLRPRLFLSTQWHVLPLLSKAFPTCNILDLRSLRVPQGSGQHLQDTAFTESCLSNVKAGCSDQAVQELHEYIACACSHRPSLCFSVDIGLQNAPAASFTDRFCLALLRLPRCACVTNLDASSWPVPVTHRGLSHIAQITSLTKLQLICDYDQDVGDEHLKLLSALTKLTDLCIGPLHLCTSEGLIHALSRLCYLERLSLGDAIHFSAKCLACVSAAKLQALSLHYCTQLTDESVSCLSMPHLSELSFREVHGLSAFGLECLLAQSPALVHLNLLHCAGVTEKDLTLLSRRVQNQLWYRGRKPILFNYHYL